MAQKKFQSTGLNELNNYGKDQKPGNESRPNANKPQPKQTNNVILITSR
jgi:hypothetical protein